MRTPWTFSTIEAAIFLGLVLVLTGAGTWAASHRPANASQSPEHLTAPPQL